MDRVAAAAAFVAIQYTSPAAKHLATHTTITTITATITTTIVDRQAVAGDGLAVVLSPLLLFFLLLLHLPV